MAVLKTAARKPEKLMVNFSATEAEKKAIQALADKYADGNLSAWLRYAALHCKPAKGDLVAS